VRSATLRCKVDKRSKQRKMKRRIQILFSCSICAVIPLIVAPYSQAQPASALPAGAVATHVIGRLLIATDGTGQLLGYYPSRYGPATDKLTEALLALPSETTSGWLPLARAGT
jgi:hypothetical protein